MLQTPIFFYDFQRVSLAVGSNVRFEINSLLEWRES